MIFASRATSSRQRLSLIEIALKRASARSDSGNSSARHRRALDQHREHRHARLERGGHFMGDPVVGIVEPSPAIGVARLGAIPGRSAPPPRRRCPGVADHLAEVGAAGNAPDVAETRLSPK